ncbi:MAG: ribosome small subunit-dependent GTPase A [Clostridiales bacterium]|nr:ribosome small subunit-dependent GTPase A [Clostridiales bacterium]
MDRRERYLALACQSGAVPVVLLKKADLAENHEDLLDTNKEAAVGVNVQPISAITGYGLGALEYYLKPGKTILLLGSSGVGKSTFLNALMGHEVMSASEIREKDSRRRHTTAHREMFVLSNSSIIIDTPGLREVGMRVVPEGLNEAFEDVERYFANCRFSDCRHDTEPGCAVKMAIESGELSLERWESYLKLKREKNLRLTEVLICETRIQETQKMERGNCKYEKNRKKYARGTFRGIGESFWAGNC